MGILKISAPERSASARWIDEGSSVICAAAALVTSKEGLSATFWSDRLCQQCGFSSGLAPTGARYASNLSENGGARPRETAGRRAPVADEGVQCDVAC